jgi:hypothetical protein
MSVDASATIAAAQQSGGDSSLFSTALGFLSGLNKQDADDLDEDDVQRKHDQAYNQQGASNMSANGLGAAAALQAFKKFTSGDQDAKKAEQGGGDMMSKLVGLAMGEAGSVRGQHFIADCRCSTRLAEPPLAPSRTLSLVQDRRS